MRFGYLPISLSLLPSLTSPALPFPVEQEGAASTPSMAPLLFLRLVHAKPHVPRLSVDMAWRPRFCCFITAPRSSSSAASLVAPVSRESPSPCLPYDPVGPPLHPLQRPLASSAPSASRGRTPHSRVAVAMPSRSGPCARRHSVVAAARSWPPSTPGSVKPCTRKKKMEDHFGRVPRATWIRQDRQDLLLYTSTTPARSTTWTPSTTTPKTRTSPKTSTR